MTMLETQRRNHSDQIPEWFILNGEQQRGPYFLSQLRERVESGTLSSESLAWRNGMDDWQALKLILTSTNNHQNNHQNNQKNNLQISEWSAQESQNTAPAWDHTLDGDLWMEKSNELKNFADDTDASCTTKMKSNEILRESLSDSIFQNEKSWSSLLAIRDSDSSLARELSHDTIESHNKSVRASEIVYIDSAAFLNPKPPITVVKPKKFRIVLASSIAGILIAVLIYFFISQILPILPMNKVNFENLPDVSREENRALQAAISESYKKHGANAAIAVSLSDPATPFFYVASNLNDGSRIEVHIDALQDTLLENLNVSVRSPASIKNGLVRSPQFKQMSGKPFPRGEYRVTAVCADCPGVATGATLAQKTYFLGGQRDLDYEQKLRIFHEKLRLSAQAELNEIRQYTDTLSSQLNETVSHFQNKKLKLKNTLKK